MIPQLNKFNRNSAGFHSCRFMKAMIGLCITARNTIHMSAQLQDNWRNNMYLNEKCLIHAQASPLCCADSDCICWKIQSYTTEVTGMLYATDNFTKIPAISALLLQYYCSSGCGNWWWEHNKTSGNKIYRLFASPDLKSSHNIFWSVATLNLKNRLLSEAFAPAPVVGSTCNEKNWKALSVPFLYSSFLFYYALGSSVCKLSSC